MIIDKVGQVYLYENEAYYIGQKIIATDESDYAGLVGTITEIYDGDDKETDNKTPDIYCSFVLPKDPTIIKELEERFSKLYSIPKNIDDISFDLVIMAPDMIKPFEEN